MDQDYGMKEFFASVDVAVMGRKTYDKALELSPNGLSFPGMKTYVFSHLMAKGKQENIEVVSEPPETWVKSIRATPGKDIWLVGGGEMVREFLQKRLVNEIGISIHPRLLGDGDSPVCATVPGDGTGTDTVETVPSGLLQLFYRLK